MAGPEAEKKLILLAEDEAVIALAEAQTLKRHGYEVVTAKSAVQAVEKALQLPRLDLVLMDINLGKGMDGTEAAELILRRRDVPVVFLSSHTETEILTRTEKVTSYGYVVKNSGETVLLASMRMAFRLFETRCDLQAQTERIESATRALKEKSDELEDYFDSSLDLLCIADMDGYFRRLNPEWQTVLGYSIEELQNKRFLDLVHPEDLDLTLAAVRTLEKQHEVAKFVNRYRAKSGEYRWIEWHSRPHGKLIYASARDITEQRNIEQALRLSEAYQRAIIDHAPFGGHFYRLEPDGRLILEGGNVSADRILGIDHGPLTGKTIEDAFPGLGKTEIPATYKRIAAVGETAHWDQVNYSQGGISGAYEVHAFQTIPGRMAVFFIDITDRKKSEETIRKSEDRFQSFMHNFPGLAYIKDAGLRTVFANEGFLTYLGLKPADMIGRTSGELFAPDFARRIDKDDSAVLTSTEGRTFEEEFAGRTWMTYKFVIPQQQDKALLGGLTLDISERKQMEKNLADALREKSALLRELQHRVKNSLAMITALVGLELGRTGSPVAAVALEDLKSRIATLSGLFVLFDASNDAGEIRLDVYLQRIVGSLLDSYRPNHPNVEERIRIEPITIDTKRAASIGLIVNELLTNALKYAFPGLRSGTLEVELRREDAGLLLVVSDDGAGLPDGFDPKNSTGIGLEIVRMLVEQLGGTLSFDRADRTRFIVRLPFDND